MQFGGKNFDMRVKNLYTMLELRKRRGGDT